MDHSYPEPQNYLYPFNVCKTGLRLKAIQVLNDSIRFQIYCAVRSLSKAAAICKKAVAVRIQMNSTAGSLEQDSIFYASCYRYEIRVPSLFQN